MAKNFTISMQIAQGHLRLVLNGNLTDIGIMKILRAADAGLNVFPVIIVDLQEAKETTEEAVNLLEKGLQRIISVRKNILLKTNKENGT
jgi:hypothetical protein